MSIFSKLSFLFKKPKAVVVIGDDRKETKDFVYQVLRKYLKVGREVLIFEADLGNGEDSGGCDHGN